MQRELQIHVVDTALELNPADGKQTIRFRRQNGADVFRVRLYIEGPQLPYVKSVTYKLHPTFPRPVRQVERSAANQNCELVIWAWGVFEAGVVVEDLEGRLYDLKHQMTFGRELRNDVRYVEEESAEPERPRLRVSGVRG